MPCAPVHAGRAHPHQDMVVTDGRPGYLLKPEDLFRCGAVCGLDDRLHCPGAAGRAGRRRRVVEGGRSLCDFVLAGHRAVPIASPWDAESLDATRRPRITSQSANTNSPMPVI